MRVTFHDYLTDPALSQRDGVNLAHENIASLLKSAHGNGIEASSHDFNRLLADDSYARNVLTKTDCVVSNVGPHAHFYFQLREKLSLDFRIVRDVRTALWSSYLHQEHLIQPLLRPQDLLMVASRFTRAIYQAMFPHLEQFPTLICYPLTVAFPEPLPDRPQANNSAQETLTLGYLGRLSEDKNFPDIVSLLIHLNQHHDKRFRLLACGDVHSASCNPVAVRRRLRQALGSDELFEYLPACDNSEVWEVYRRMDVLLFPSTSNLETFGRVLVEASHVGLPVVCGDHAATSELMPREMLCQVEYASGQDFCAHTDHALGRVSIDDMARVLTQGPLRASSCHLDYREHGAAFLRALTSTHPDMPAPATTQQPTASQQAFIDRLQISMPQALDRTQAVQLIEQLAPWFLGLQQQGGAERGRMLEQLLQLSALPERTQRFIARSESTRCDFTNVGGIDIELCHISGFSPRFQLCEQATESCALPAFA